MFAFQLFLSNLWVWSSEIEYWSYSLCDTSNTHDVHPMIASQDIHSAKLTIYLNVDLKKTYTTTWCNTISKTSQEPALYISRLLIYYSKGKWKYLIVFINSYCNHQLLSIFFVHKCSIDTNNRCTVFEAFNWWCKYPKNMIKCSQWRITGGSVDELHPRVRIKFLYSMQPFWQ